MATATNVTNAKAGMTGPIYWAPIGTTLPTKVDDVLDAAFKALGFVSEDGVSNNNSPETEDVKSWGGYTVLNMQTERPDTFSFSLLEALNVDLLKVVYGSDNVTDDSGSIAIKATADEMTHGVWVIDSILQGGKKERVVIPNAAISELGTIVRKDSEPIAYELTIKAVPDSDGVYHYQYIA